MNCMKCGREIALGQVFCKECLADMATAPINPGTPVHLPTPPAVTPARRSSGSRKAKKPEEQIATLKKWVIGLCATLLVVILTFSVAIAILSHKLEDAQNAATPGQNYSTSEDFKTVP